MSNAEKDADVENSPFRLKIEQLIELQKRMSADELAALQAWEAKHLGHDGEREIGTTDWPGWVEIIKRYSH